MISLVIICPGLEKVLGQVVQKVDNAIHWLNLSIQWITQLISLILIHWIAIYLVDSIMERLNNQRLSGSLSQWTRFLASHPLIKSLTKTSNRSGSRQAKYESCLLKVQAGIQVFFSPDAADPPGTQPLVLPRTLLKPYTAPRVNPTGLYCQHICEYVSQLPRYTRGQDQNGLCCQQLLIWARTVSQAIPVAILHAHGWHMRTRLYRTVSQVIQVAILHVDGWHMRTRLYTCFFLQVTVMKKVRKEQKERNHLQLPLKMTFYPREDQQE